VNYNELMSESEPRHIVSRRARPAKSPLSQEAIVATALDLLSREGMAGLSLRKVATALDTGAASLYVYVANLDELHALVLDRVLGEVALPAARVGDWRERLKAVLRSYSEALYTRPGLAQVALSTIPSGPNMVELTECLLGLLHEGGVQLDRAAWAVDLLLLHTSAFAAERDNRRSDDDKVALHRAQAALGAVSAEGHPHIHALGAELFSGEQNRYAWALDVLINGVLDTPRP
jgi:AcrR family transcriptional regulator